MRNGGQKTAVRIRVNILHTNSKKLTQTPKFLKLKLSINMCKWKRINLYKPEILNVISLLGIQGGLRGVPQIISCTFNFTGFFSSFTVKQQSQTKLEEKLLHDYILPVFIF